MVTATSNGVNLTDGLDGLATGTSCMVFGAYVIIAYWQFRNSCVTNPIHNCYVVRDPLDITIVAAAAMGACFGFLWWNAPPAGIFMGDTGSLALGGLFAGDRDRDPHRAAARGAWRPVRPGDAVSVIIQVVVVPRLPPTGLPDGAVPSPLRAGRAGTRTPYRAVLDHRRARAWPSGSASSTRPSSRRRDGQLRRPSCRRSPAWDLPAWRRPGAARPRALVARRRRAPMTALAPRLRRELRERGAAGPARRRDDSGRTRTSW